MVGSCFAHQSFFSCDQTSFVWQSYFAHLAGRVTSQAISVQAPNLPCSQRQLLQPSKCEIHPPPHTSAGLVVVVVVVVVTRLALQAPCWHTFSTSVSTQSSASLAQSVQLAPSARPLHGSYAHFFTPHGYFLQPSAFFSSDGTYLQPACSSTQPATAHLMSAGLGAAVGAAVLTGQHTAQASVGWVSHLNPASQGWPPLPQLLVSEGGAPVQPLTSAHFPLVGAVVGAGLVVVVGDTAPVQSAQYVANRAARIVAYRAGSVKIPSLAIQTNFLVLRRTRGQGSREGRISGRLCVWRSTPPRSA